MQSGLPSLLFVGCRLGADRKRLQQPARCRIEHVDGGGVADRGAVSPLLEIRCQRVAGFHPGLIVDRQAIGQGLLLRPRGLSFLERAIPRVSTAQGDMPIARPLAKPVFDIAAVDGVTRARQVEREPGRRVRIEQLQGLQVLLRRGTNDRPRSNARRRPIATSVATITFRIPSHAPLPNKKSLQDAYRMKRNRGTAACHGRQVQDTYTAVACPGRIDNNRIVLVTFWLGGASPQALPGVRAQA